MDLKKLSESVRRIAIDAGLFLKEERKRFNQSRVEEKSAHNYVSYVDKESERRIVEQLSQLLPEAGLIAEEGSGNFTTQEYCWVVDPLDGTTNYIHDLAPYCVSIALRNQKEILVGVVYEVCRNECFYAWKGGKAWLNGEEIHVTSIQDFDKALIEIGFPYNDKAYHSTAIQLVDSLYGKVGGTRLMGAAAAELCYIAAGRAEVRIEAYLGPWDIAAGGIILMEAGGKLTDFEGGSDCWSGKEVLATNGYLHEKFLKENRIQLP